MGFCVGRRPKRFLHATRCLENLSSGLKRAGCADCVGEPSGAVFCRGEGREAEARESDGCFRVEGFLGRDGVAKRGRGGTSWLAHLQGVHPLPLLVEIVHQIPARARRGECARQSSVGARSDRPWGESRGGRSGGGAGANRQGDAGAGWEIAHILRLIRSQTLSTR